ncbi:MAG: hypothetical protein EBZ95_05330 [Chitinophagia bacterium]|nr:hypothetical protein [Chitinophagia bacterium]
MSPQIKIISPLFLVFNLTILILYAIRGILAQWGIDLTILNIANCIFFLLSVLTFFMQRKALENSNPNVFIRSVMGGMLIKMFVTISVVIAYRLIAGNSVSKVSVFSAMFLYLLYLGVEVAVITKLNRQKNG